MSEPSWASTSFDLAAAPLSCSRSKEPTAGMSRSMMNLRMGMEISVTLGAEMLAKQGPEEQSPQGDDDEVAGREQRQAVHDMIVREMHYAVGDPQSHIDPGQNEEGRVHAP